MERRFWSLGAFLLALTLSPASAEAAPGKSPNPDAIAAVAAGELTEANAAWWGFDAEDSTDALQGAIDSGAAKVLVPYMGAPWIARPIRLRGGLELVFEPGVVVLAKEGEFKGGGDSLFHVSDAENITLLGYGATLRMRKADYQTEAYKKAEWRMTLTFSGCTGIHVEGLRLESSGGDGIYLGCTGTQPFCKDVTIRNVTCLDHHRQGISIIGAENLLIENCVFSGTEGTAPEAGIDFEPNRANEKLVNCVVRGCRFEDNAGAGILVYLKNLDRNTEPVSLLFEDCLVKGGKDAGVAIGAAGDNGPKGTVTFRNCTIEDTFKAGAFLYDKSVESVAAIFENCNWRNPWRGVDRKLRTPKSAILISLLRVEIAKKQGGFLFQDCHIYDDRDQPVLVVEGKKDAPGIRNLEGTLTVHNPHEARMDPGPEPHDVSLRIVAAGSP